MIAFKALMHAIHQSISAASKAVEDEGIKHIDNFFDKIVNENYHDIDDQEKNIGKAKLLLDGGDVAAASKILESVGKNLQKSSSIAPEEKVTYRPKMVAMAFPCQTPNGIESAIVNVPLITLSPISSPRVKEVKFTADLEVTADENNELFIAFPSARKESGWDEDFPLKTTNTHIEIILTGGEAPQGLQKIIEGYEKALRAQIPG